MSDKKTLMNEVLPAPSPAPARTPRSRAQSRLELLAKKAALAGAAGSLSACIGYGVVDPLPEPVECSAADDVNLWVLARVGGTLPNITLTLSLDTGGFADVQGVTLANQFDVEGATLVGDPQFDAADLKSSRTVVVSLQVNDGASEVVVHTGLTCADQARAVDVRIDVASFTATVVDAG